MLHYRLYFFCSISLHSKLHVVVRTFESRPKSEEGLDLNVEITWKKAVLLHLRLLVSSLQHIGDALLTHSLLG